MAIYGLPQVGALTNKRLRAKLTPAGYYEVARTLGLWKHVTQPVQLSLVADDFGVKYVGKENVDHLIQTFRKYYKSIEEDRVGNLYYGITLD